MWKNNEDKKIDRGTSNFFKIYTKDNNTYILKEFNSNTKMKNVKQEISIINYLKDKGISVPKYLRNNNGYYYCIINGKIIIVQEFVEGNILKDNTGNYKETIASATMLGKIVKALKEYEGFDDEEFIQEELSKEALSHSISLMEQFYKDYTPIGKYDDTIKKDIQEKIKIGKDLLENFDFTVIDKLSIYGTHGDYNVQQLIYSNNDNNITVIDFETAKKMPIVWEIMRSYSYMDSTAKDGNIDVEKLIAYFKEFCKYASLNEYDLKFAPYVYLIQIIGSMFGYKEYIKDNSQTELLNFGFFRTKLCKFLYKNANIISKELVKNINLNREESSMISYIQNEKKINFRVGGIITKEEGKKILLHQLTGFNFWLLPGGRVEMLESTDTTIIREIKEGLGIDVETKRLVAITESFFDIKDITYHELAFNYILNVPEDSKIMQEQEEFSGIEGEKYRYKWFDREKLNEIIIKPNYLTPVLQEFPEEIVHIIKDERKREEITESIEIGNEKKLDNEFEGR